MPNRWLFKEEPTKYSFADLVNDRRTEWDGVRNNLALKHLRQVREGDEVLYYQTGKERAAVGIMRVVSDPYPDPSADNERFVLVDVEPVRELASPVTLAALKEEPSFADSPLVRIPRLSVMPVTDAQWKAVLELAGG